MKKIKSQFSIRNKQSHDKKGFVILIAVLVASLLISLGAFIANIAVKELTLSTSGRDSSLAFYAADAAIECALYQDLHVQQYATSSSATGPATTLCNSTSTPVTVNGTLSNASRGVSQFSISFPQATGNDPNFSPFATVRITKNDIGGPGDETIIESRGYNVMSTSTSNRVERALEVTY